jgi:hypothetical protein
MKHRAGFLFMAASIALSAAAQTASPMPEKQNGTSKVAALLDGSGRPYSKVREGVWEIDFTGDNVKRFPVRLAMADELLVVISKIADRKDLTLGPELLTKCLEMNHHMDSIKVALSEEMLYVRMDVRWRTLDPAELKYVLDQISAATDEISPQIKPYLTPAPAK